jgi:hypothetical protein
MFSISEDFEIGPNLDAIFLIIDINIAPLTDQYTYPRAQLRVVGKRFAGGLSGI